MNELSDQIVGEFSSCLEKTLSPDPNVRRPAEKFLEQMQTQANYGTVLLFLSSKQELAMHLRVCASITFKNYIKRNWPLDEESEVVDRIAAADRDAIKASITELMLSNPEQIQRQLSDAISIISKEDFPAKWPDLLPKLVARLNGGDFHVTNGVLQTAHSIFKRYRHEFQSDALWREIKYVLGAFAAPFTQLFQTLVGLVETYAHDAASLRVIFSSLILVAKIFRSLNSQDFPEEFENSLDVWMGHFLTLLSYENALLASTSDEAGPLEQIKSQICDNVSLFAQNYGEDFAGHLPAFVKAVWDLLITTSLHAKYDLLVSNAIQFLTTVVYRPQYRSLFDDEATLRSICEKIVIPNLFLRDVDIEIFEDNPEEYLRKDIERSDTDTRRRAASDLVQALSAQFEKQVVAIFSAYVSALLQEYAAAPAANWRQKDVVLFLVTTLASRAQTKKHGTTKASELIDVIQFYESTILPDLSAADINAYPVLKADAMKYISTFRQQLPKELLTGALAQLTRYLASSVPVVQTYACHSIERVLTVKTGGGVSGGGGTGGTNQVTAISKENAFQSADLDALMPQLLAGILDLLQPNSANGENEYAIKTLMRVASVMQERIEPYLDTVIGKLIQMLNAISKNPSKPNFNHYLFETFGVLIRAVCAHHRPLISKFEAHLFPVFNYVLEQDITEFIPYSFQLLSLMLELHDDTAAMPAAYVELFPFLLMPVLWERPGYVPALVRLLQAYVEKAAATIVTEKIMAVLGVFQRLIASKSNDHYAFYILNSLTEHLPGAVLAEYIKQILFLLFQRLNSSKTTKLIKNMLVFTSLYIYKYGAASMRALVDGLQAGMFSMLLDKLFVLETQKVSGTLERKICAVGITKILVEEGANGSAALFASEAATKTWVGLLESLVGLFELPEDTTTLDDDHFVDVEDTPAYSGAFNQLFSASKRDPDPFRGEIPDAKFYLAKNLELLASQMPGKVPLLLAQLSGPAQTHLQSYLTGANVLMR